MLDTDVCIELLRGRALALASRIRTSSLHDFGVSCITLAELQHGVARSHHDPGAATRVARFCAPLAVLVFRGQDAEMYGSLRARLERAGTPIGPLDTLIAAHALARDLTLITNNRREFDRVPNLRVENGLAS